MTPYMTYLCTRFATKPTFFRTLVHLGEAPVIEALHMNCTAKTSSMRSVSTAILSSISNLT
jgi:hypothetical protein